MRIERTQAKKGSRNGLVGAVMGLALVAGTLLSLGARTEPATSSIEVGKPEAVNLVSTTADRISPREEIADRDTLDLQLD